MKNGDNFNFFHPNNVYNYERKIPDNHFVGALDTTMVADFWECAKLVDCVDNSIHHPLCRSWAILCDMIVDR